MKGYNELNFQLNEENQLYEYLFSRWVFLKYFKRVGKLADFGSGNGNNALAFKKLGFNVSVCDTDPSFFNRLKKEGIKCYKMNLDKNFLLRDNSLDFIFAKSLIEHLESPENFLKEAFRCLKKGGKIFLQTPNWEKGYKVFYNDPTHRSPLTKNSLSALSKLIGFKIVEIRNFRSIPGIWRLMAIKSFRNISSLWKFCSMNSFEMTFFPNNEMIGVLEKQ
ncbi:MAG: class I SAM-dependent methyltransferase [archaeon]